MDEIRKNFDRLNKEKGVSYCCIPGAYGRAIKGRSTDLLERFSDAVKDPMVQRMWHDLTHNPNTTYDDIYSFFISRAPAESRLEGKLFHTIGTLQAHLLASDVHYALRQKSPSPQDMGNAVVRLKMGAWHGMMKLGLIRQCPFSELTEDEVSQAFVNAYQNLEGKLTKEQKENMGWDAGMLEHTFCKYSKLHRFKANEKPVFLKGGKGKQTDGESSKRKGRKKAKIVDQDSGSDYSDI